MDLKDYTGQYNELTRFILKKYAGLKTGENIVFSPFSVIMLLGIAAASAVGMAHDEIVKAAGATVSDEQLQGILKVLQAAFTENGTLVSSNAVCVQESLQESITAGYDEMLEEVFSGKLFASKDIVSDVNAWVNENTRGMINEIADDSMRQMLACMLNAAAFESEWENPYEENDIYDGEFTNSDQSISRVQMMDSREYTYIENEDFTGFVKPYKGMEYSYMALLPKKESMKTPVQALENLDFTKLLHKGEYVKVAVTMPEYKYSFGENITEICKEMGIKTIFSADADFSPMSGEWLKVDSIIHKAHIEVDRKGTKAAAVTAAFVVGAAPVFDFKAVCLDRPFVFAIVHNETGLPVFCGVMNHAE